MGADSCLTSLDPIETTVEHEPDSAGRVNPSHTEDVPYPFRHTHWRKTRQRIRAALDRINAPHARLEAWDDCGRGHWLLRNKTDRTLWKVVPSHCHDRFCQPCQAARSARICANLAERIGDHPHRLLTLTIRSTPTPLAPQVTRLLQAFRRLRATPTWRRCVRGGCAFLEVTRNDQTGLWHPHLHVILDGLYFPKPTLNQLWLAATGDSDVTHITLVRDPHTVQRYVSKYATKPWKHTPDTDDRAIDELLTATKSRRHVIPFGTWRHWKLLRDDSEKNWRLICHSNELAHRGPNATDDALAAWTFAQTLDNWTTGVEFTYEHDPP